MPTECSSLVVTISCLPQVPENSEMIINTNCLVDLYHPPCDIGELVVSSHKIPVHWEWTSECTPI